MSECVFKPGVEYRCRNGRPGGVYWNGPKWLHGWIADGDTDRRFVARDVLGRYNGNGCEHNYDLMPPDPPRPTLDTEPYPSDLLYATTRAWSKPADVDPACEFIKWGDDPARPFMYATDCSIFYGQNGVVDWSRVGNLTWSDRRHGVYRRCEIVE